MEIVGGFMVMMSIIGLFLAVIWLIMPFVVLAIKGKQDRTLECMERVEKRLSELDARLTALQSSRQTKDMAGDKSASDETGQDLQRADSAPAPFEPLA